ncbi:hypothetical protein [Janthinobacterium sp. NKUCC06_STL]|uniref:hypothetical protein n=1 Tax=Janthinobacterium sp. NKUCC06_STL TaxID=2842127 RepID=UPI001C5AF28A|nr:hypothetical protein [Janthinobacterium sp. NKUCC06_STL]MBW3512898.1 hypothetical protein [Janthinobacterium sp. NKUCC06_STL]
MAINLNYFKTHVVRYTALAVVGLASLVTLGVWCGLNKTDWGTWVGSVGTVGTLIGTMLLATSERRNRSRQEFALAQVTAASFAERIRVLRHLLEQSIEALKVCENDIFKADFAGLYRTIDDIRIWSPAETIPLITLPGKVAMKLSALAAEFVTAQKNLAAMHKSRRDVEPDTMKARCRAQIDTYSRMIATLDKVTGICRYACLESSEAD